MSTGAWVVLVGPPGAGVSSVANLVAAERGLPVIDTEREAARALGFDEDVARAFVVAGQEAFQNAESAAALIAFDREAVVALGSGALLDSRVAAAVPPRLVQLTVSLAFAAGRLGLATARPVFLGNPRAQWTRLAGEREAIYATYARASVNTDDLTLRQVADRVIAAMED